MARAIWSGSISFGLVNIPIKVVTAVTDKDIRFHMLHEKDGARIKFKRICPKDEEEVRNEDIVRGYEVGRGEYVTFTDEELAQADPAAARTIDISEFVALAEIDPSYYEKPYYLIPDKNADKSYALLLAAMQKAEKVAIARVVMREKEYLVAIRAKGDALMMETMHFAEEVIPPEALEADIKTSPKDVDKKQLALAEQLIESLTEPFAPEKHKNTHRDRVMALIEAKLKGKEVIQEPAATPAVKTVDLMSALETSLARVRRKGAAPVAEEEDAIEAKKPRSAHPRPKRKAP
jgi:DNA end-binding protein Ku